MVRAEMCGAAGVFVAVIAWAGIVHFTFPEVDAAQPPKSAVSPDAKSVDLTALRDAVDAAAKKGENVDEVVKALEALEKAAPRATGRAVPAELQALRNAVDAAAKKGENVEAITRELVKVETAVAGRELTRPKPQPQPDPIQRIPRPPVVAPPLQIFPNPGFGNPGVGGFGGAGGFDLETFNKVLELRERAVELLKKNPDDPNVQKEADKLLEEATALIMKAALADVGGRGAAGIGVAPLMPLPGIGRAPDFGAVPDRARLGIRLERVPALTAEQLGLEANTGIAVTMVVAGSAAEKAGLKVHDIILEFGGKAVTDNLDEFINRVNAVKAGEKVDIVLLRKGKKVDVKGIELPAARPFRAPPQLQPAVPNVANPFLKAADVLGEPAKLPANPIPKIPAPLVPNPLPLMP